MAWQGSVCEAADVREASRARVEIPTDGGGSVGGRRPRRRRAAAAGSPLLVVQDRPQHVEPRRLARHRGGGRRAGGVEHAGVDHPRAAERTRARRVGATVARCLVHQQAPPRVLGALGWPRLRNRRHLLIVVLVLRLRERAAARRGQQGDVDACARAAAERPLARDSNSVDSNSVDPACSVRRLVGGVDAGGVTADQADRTSSTRARPC